MPPAAGVIKHIGPQASPTVYLELLESVRRGGISEAECKPKATAHQMSTLVAGVGGAATGEVNTSEKAMACINKQLAPLKNSVSWRGQADHKEAE